VETAGGGPIDLGTGRSIAGDRPGYSFNGAEGNWQQIINSVMNLPPHMPELIKDLCAKNTRIACSNHVILTPQQFAEMFVNRNWTS